MFINPLTLFNDKTFQRRPKCYRPKYINNRQMTGHFDTPACFTGWGAVFQSDNT